MSNPLAITYTKWAHVYGADEVPHNWWRQSSLQSQLVQLREGLLISFGYLVRALLEPCQLHIFAGSNSDSLACYLFTCLKFLRLQWVPQVFVHRWPWERDGWHAALSGSACISFVASSLSRASLLLQFFHLQHVHEMVCCAATLQLDGEYREYSYCFFFTA